MLPPCRSRGVVQIKAKITFEPEKVNIFNKDCQRGGKEVTCMSVTVCLSLDFRTKTRTKTRKDVGRSTQTCPLINPCGIWSPHWKGPASSSGIFSSEMTFKSISNEFLNQIKKLHLQIEFKDPETLLTLWSSDWRRGQRSIVTYFKCNGTFYMLKTHSTVVMIIVSKLWGFLLTFH